MRAQRSLAAGTELRRAARTDNSALLEFLASHAMRAKLALHFDRSPDFFALLDVHSDVHETWLLVAGGRILGMGTIVLRRGYVDGRVEDVVYLGELRLQRHRQAAGRWRALLFERLAALREQYAVRYAYCCIMRDNLAARAAVMRARADRLDFTQLRGYSTVAVLARKLAYGARRSAVAVRRATVADGETLRAFLDRDGRGRPLGVVFDAPTWARRLATWPGLTIDSFYLAVAPQGEIVGCLAPWDCSSINRIVIEHLPPAARWLRGAYNALAPLLRKPRIPADAMAHLPDVWLTHVAVRDRDPGVFAALLDAAYTDLAATARYATVSLCAFDGDPLGAALDAYWCYRVPMDVYAWRVDPQAPPLSSPAQFPPGFESYLV